jgi:hypothetical protein
VPEKTRALLHLEHAEVAHPAVRRGLVEAITHFRQSDERGYLALAVSLEALGLVHNLRMDDARSALPEADAAIAPMPPSKLKARTLVAVGATAWVLGEPQAGKRKVESGLEMHGAFGNITGRWKSAVKASEVLHLGGLHADAIAVTEQMLPEVRNKGSGYYVCLLTTNLTAYYLSIDNFDAARTLIAEAANALPREDRLGLLCVTQHAADLALHDGDVRRAALVLGFVDRGFAAIEGGRQNTERMQRDRMLRRLEEAIDPDTLAAYLAEGSAMDAFEAEREARLGRGETHASTNGTATQ